MQKCDTKGPKKIEDNSSITGVVSAGWFENFGDSAYESQNENKLLTASIKRLLSMTWSTAGCYKPLLS